MQSEINFEIEKSWRVVLKDTFESEVFESLTSFIRKEYAEKEIFPKAENIFRALNLTPIENVKVVILGQDPYHGNQNGMPQAQGLSFSVPKEIKNPPSLINIFKELESELGKKCDAEVRFGGDLSCWARQGVLLLNAVLTVETGRAGSHANKGWEGLTDEIIRIISSDKEHVVFMLWGSYASKKAGLIDTTKHLILESVHPSPLSAYGGFFGNGHFLKVNSYLKEHGETEIVW